jgi:hypothetical protein
MRCHQNESRNGNAIHRTGLRVDEAAPAAAIFLKKEGGIRVIPFVVVFYKKKSIMK